MRRWYVICFFALLFCGTAWAQTPIMARMTITGYAYDDGRGVQLKGANSIFFDRRTQELFVADPGNHRVVIYDRDLLPLYAFDHFVKDPSKDSLIPGEPRGAVANSEGDIIVIDNLSSTISVHDFRGRLLQSISLPHLVGDTTLQVRPVALAIDEQDNLYVATSVDLVTVLVLDRDLNLVRRIGAKGPLPQEVNSIVSLTVHDGRVYLTDLYSVPAVKIFDSNGTYVSGFGKHDVDKGDLSLPSGIMVIEKEHPDSPDSTELLIWVSDALRQVLKVYTADGEFTSFVGGSGFDLGKFSYPSGIATDGDSTIYTVERHNSRVQRFRFR